MRLIEHFVAEPRPCSYLPAEIACLEYKIMLDVGPDDFEAMLERGWRRFGPAYFRPMCAACSECVPIRIPVADFRPSKSQRRVAKRGAEVRLEIGPAQVNAVRMDLYHRWHTAQGDRRNWERSEMSARRYYEEFAFPHPCLKEFSYYLGEQLIAVGIVDETPHALSAVYTYHHPEHSALSLGTLSILRQIEVAQTMGKRHLYLGYRILDCPSSRYKARFWPHELLSGWPRPESPPRWALAPRTIEAER